MICKFTVGQKVVCAKSGTWCDASTSLPFDFEVPKEGGCYEISDIEPSRTGGPKIYLTFCGLQGSYNSIHFRPVRTFKNDISCFTKLLAPKKEDAHV